MGEEKRVEVSSTLLYTLFAASDQKADGELIAHVEALEAQYAHIGVPNEDRALLQRDAERLRAPESEDERTDARMALRYHMLQAMQQIPAVREHLVNQSPGWRTLVDSLIAFSVDRNLLAFTPRGAQLAGLDDDTQRRCANPAHLVQSVAVFVACGIVPPGQPTGTLLDAPLSMPCFSRREDE